MPATESAGDTDTPVRRVRTTCPRDCYDSCGIVVVCRPGAAPQVRGDPEHPVSRGTLCGKCSVSYNREWLDPGVRLTSPLRRAGPKGSGRFEAVSWDTALSEIAARLHAIIGATGPQAILNAHYTGTISLLAGVFPMRFFNRLGATEVAPDTICNMAGHVALNYTYGTSVDGFDPRTAAEARCIIVWGANPSASAPHADTHWLAESGATVVVVDPVVTGTAARAAVHLQLRPGTDALLAFALLKVIVTEGLEDRAFIEANVLGYADLRESILAIDLADAAARTGIDEARIRRVARLYAAGPSLLWLGQGLQRQPAGGNVMRACAALPAVTGNIGRPGAGILYLNGNAAARGVDDACVLGSIGGPAAPSVSHMDLAGWLADPRRSQALFVWNMNPAASNPDQRRLRQALLREDLLTVTADLFMTDSALVSDYVLPAASFLEFDDLVLSYFNYTISAQVAAVPSPGLALSNSEIFRRLAAAMNFSEAELRESDAAILDRALAGCGAVSSFAELARLGTVNAFAEPYVPFADHRYPTPSGKIELVSARALADGHPLLAQPEADPGPAEGWLRLLSPASTWTCNTSFGNVGRVRTRLGAPSILLHPADARSRSIADGESVRVHNSTGSLEATATISDAVQPGVALIHKGRWPGLEASGANVNVLNPGARTDMGDSSAVHGVEVRVEPLAGVAGGGGSRQPSCVR